MEVERYTYASGWRRLGALLVDSLVVVPADIAVQVAALASTSWIETYFVVTVLTALYPPIMHALFGQTLGKMLLDIHVRRVDGERISWARAFSRSSVDLALLAAQLTVLALAWHQSTHATGPVYSTVEVTRYLESFAEGDELRLVGAAWTWSEIITMLTNKKRRALHDFIAGTVVLRRLPDA